MTEEYTINQIAEIDRHLRQARYEGRRSAFRELSAWLSDNVEYEDYCIKHGISTAAPYQRACWLSVLEKIQDLYGEP
jgi:hypothetical protein